MREDYVLQALGALAESDRDKEASPEMEARLMDAFRSRQVRRRRRWAGMAALAAGLAIGALLWTHRVPQTAARAVPLVSLAPEAPQPAPAAVVSAPKLVRAPHRAARKIAAVRQPESREIVTDFFPLMSSSRSFERGQLLRVELPASAMQTVGLPVRQEHLDDLVQADVLVGEEGMPRAIRFVRFDVK